MHWHKYSNIVINCHMHFFFSVLDNVNIFIYLLFRCFFHFSFILLKIMMLIRSVFLSYFIGPNMEPTCISSCAKCCKSCSISLWHVSSFDEKYLLVERNLSIASSGKACSWWAFVRKSSASCSKYYSKCSWCNYENWKNSCFCIWGLGWSKCHWGSQVCIMTFYLWSYFF